MHKVASITLSRHKKPFTNYNKFYRKLVSKNMNQQCYKSSTSNPESTFNVANEELWEDILDKSLQKRKNKTKFFARNSSNRIRKVSSGRSQISVVSTSVKKNFPFSNAERNSCNYYKEAIKQCNKIRNKNRKTLNIVETPWTPEPFKGNFELISKPIDDIPPTKIFYHKKQKLDNSYSHQRLQHRESKQGLKKVVFPTNLTRHRVGTYPSMNRKNDAESLLFTESKKKKKVLPSIQFVPTPLKYNNEKKTERRMEEAKIEIKNEESSQFLEKISHLEKYMSQRYQLRNFNATETKTKKSVIGKSYFLQFYNY